MPKCFMVVQTGERRRAGVDFHFVFPQVWQVGRVSLEYAIQHVRACGTLPRERFAPVCISIAYGTSTYLYPYPFCFCSKTCFSR